MEEQLIIGGFGGQGILFIGQLLAHAAAIEDKEVAYLPAYGPEMRGGTANCMVTISDRRIMSPLVSNPSAAIIMNLPSLDKYEPAIKVGGLLVVNSSMVNRKSNRQDITVCEVPANRVAEELGNMRLSNMVALGCYVAASGVVKPESIISALPKMLKKERQELISPNAKALEAGLEWQSMSKGG